MTRAVETLAALAQDTRLRVVQILLAHEPGGLSAGRIATALDVQANTLSVHLAQLSAVGLVTRERRGRSIICRAKPGTLAALLGFIARDCCHGHPDICAPLLLPETPCATTRPATTPCLPTAKDLS